MYCTSIVLVYRWPDATSGMDLLVSLSNRNEVVVIQGIVKYVYSYSDSKANQGTETEGQTIWKKVVAQHSFAWV